MVYSINETHDLKLECRVKAACNPGTDFPIQNLPFGSFRRRGADGASRIGVAIGDQVLDLAACVQHGLFDVLGSDTRRACSEPGLNCLMGLSAASWSALRLRISRILRAGGPSLEASVLVPLQEAELILPASIGDYTDFYSSIYHATNVGRLFRPDNALLPNYKYVPVGYHGRASSIVVSGESIRRPSGQVRDDPSAPPRFAPSRQLDYELEVGFFIGRGNRLGAPISIVDAESHIFGFCLVNDWSARDIQSWEYQPLGPFLGKSFATTVSPWIVTLEALEPYRTGCFNRPTDDPPPLPYLSDLENAARGSIDLWLEVHLCSQAMRRDGAQPFRMSRANFRDMYWTPAQLVAHHTSNGCNLRPGDLLASGTVSGPGRDSCGCLLEVTWRGEEPVHLPGGEVRRFLEDGDEVNLRGRCERSGFSGIGFGDCRGTILAASA